MDPLAVYNPIFEDEFYFDGDHNDGVYNSKNLNSYGYCYQSPISLVDPNGKQSFFMNTRNFSPVKSFGGLHGIAPSWSGDNRSYTTNPAKSYRIGGTANINMNKMTVSASPMKPAATHNLLTGNSTPSPSKFIGTFKKISPQAMTVKMHNSGNNAAAPGSFDIDTKSNISYTKSETRDGGSLINILGNVYGDKFPSNETYISDNFGNAVMLGTSGVKDNPEVGPYKLGGDGDIPMSNFNVTIKFDKSGKIINATNNETKKPITIDHYSID